MTGIDLSTIPVVFEKTVWSTVDLVRWCRRSTGPEVRPVELVETKGVPSDGFDGR
jgi:hypothetical protein